MVFERWDESRPRIVSYAAKWDEATPEYRDTNRTFGWREGAPHLNKALERLAQDCWTLFGLNGYARVDFRVDRAGAPFILDVNVNPCLSEDAGFAASALEAGIGYDAMIGRVIGDEYALNRDWPMASAVAVALLLLLVVPIMIYNNLQAREGEVKS